MIRDQYRLRYLAGLGFVTPAGVPEEPIPVTPNEVMMKRQENRATQTKKARKRRPLKPGQVSASPQRSYLPTP